MAVKWQSTGTKGIRFYEHPARTWKHGVIERKDRYFTIRYSVDGKQTEEKIGWDSEIFNAKKKALAEAGDDNKKKAKAKAMSNNAEEEASRRMAELKDNRRIGEGPRTLREKKQKQRQEHALKEAETLTLAEFWEKDYVHNRKPKLKPESWEKEETHYKKRILPLMGNMTLNSITSDDVYRMLDRMREDKLSARSQQYAVGTLYRIWKHAATRKKGKKGKEPLVKAGDNPAIGIEREKVNNARLRVLTPLELKSILDYLSVTDKHAHDITMFCAFTGCRFSEAGRLTWEHVDLARSAALFPDTKNKDPRQVYLVPAVVEMMERRGIGGPGEHVFTMKDGRPHSQPPFAFKTAVKNLELNKGRGDRDKVCFHSLRHTAATLAARRGTPVKDLQILFGWKTAEMVFRYAKGDEDTQRRAMQGLAQALAPEQAKVIEMVKAK